MATLRKYGSALVYLLKTLPTLGKEHQSFLDATWIRLALQTCPSAYKEKLALYILSLSPHYFYRHINSAYQRMSFFEFLEAERDRNAQSRREIRDSILDAYLDESLVVMDYGCGPGFLAKANAERVSKVYAVDISGGVLACARTINRANNIDYVKATSAGMAFIPDDVVDLTYSFAVIQHVTDEVFAHILREIHRKLKPGGKILLHLVLHSEGWRTEQQWRGDRSLWGRVRMQYGLNCFSRSSADIEAMARRIGFQHIEIGQLRTLCQTPLDDDLYHQDYLMAQKPL